jgi:outer membrane protein insertion porin family
VRLQGGQINAWGKDPLAIYNNFNVGPTLVRGFAPGGLGARDISDPSNLASNGLGGTTYVGGTLEVQFPIFGVPKEIGLRGAVFTDAGTLFGYHGQTDFSNVLGYSYCPAAAVMAVAPPTTQYSCAQVYDNPMVRSSAGVSLIWASPLGPIRLDYAVALTKSKYDQLQQFTFSGGATF